MARQQRCVLPPPLQWERVKKAGMAPGPRSSFSLVTHKGRAFLFGGASDNEAKVRGDAAVCCTHSVQVPYWAH